MEIFIYVMTFYGLTFALVYSTGPFGIFDKFRYLTKKYLPSNLGDAYDCPFCTPFQLGVLYSIINMIFGFELYTPSSVLDTLNFYWYIDIIIDGAFTASCVYLINSIQEFLENYGNRE